MIASGSQMRTVEFKICRHHVAEHSILECPRADLEISADDRRLRRIVLSAGGVWICAVERIENGRTLRAGSEGDCLQCGKLAAAWKNNRRRKPLQGVQPERDDWRSHPAEMGMDYGISGH